jgi:hypothetical protein
MKDIVEGLILSNPTFSDRFRFAHDPDGLYFCDKKSNLWSKPQALNIVARELMREILQIPLDPQQRHMLTRYKVGLEVLEVLARKKHEAAFETRLDATKAFFAVENGLFDATSVDGQIVFRNITPGDHVETATKWPYDADCARRYRHDLETFLACVVQDPTDRNRMLRFLAGFFCGKSSRQQLYLVLKHKRATDPRLKKNFILLLTAFFGPHLIQLSGWQETNNRGARLVMIEDLGYGSDTDVVATAFLPANLETVDTQDQVVIVFAPSPRPWFRDTSASMTSRWLPAFADILLEHCETV